MSITEFCRRPGMPSLPSLRKIIDHHPDFPVIERGHQGQRWKIDAEAAERFLLRLSEPLPMDVERRQRLALEMGLELIAFDRREPVDGI